MHANPYRQFLPAGHFIPEQTPGLLSQEMMHFFAWQ